MPKGENMNENKKLMRKSYSGMGWKLALFGVIATLFQIAYGVGLPSVFGDEITKNSLYVWGQMILPMYMIAFPVTLLLATQQQPVEEKPEKKKMGVGKFIICLFICAGICGVGAIIGFLVNLLAVTLANTQASVSGADTLVQMMVGSSPFWRILTVGILAPIIEEILFRKLLVDRVVKYGEWMAIFSSGLMFGLFHGNFSQFFFATGLGMFFAFIYIRTGKIWYTILMHMAVNLTTSVITVGIIQWMDLEQLMQMTTMDPGSKQAQVMALEMLPKLLVFYGWVFVLLCFAITGIVLIIVAFAKKKFYLTKPAAYVGRGSFIAAWCNIGMLLFLIYTISNFVLNYLPINLGA